MNSFLTVRKDNQQIGSISDGRPIVDTSIFEIVSLVLTSEQTNNFQKGLKGFWRNNTIEFEQNNVRAIKLDEIEQKLNQATSMHELKKEILNLVKLSR